MNIKSGIIGFMFGACLSVFGFPFYTIQFWVLVILFVAYSIFNKYDL